MSEFEYTLTMTYGYSERGGCDATAWDILKAAWEMHYRVISAHDDRHIASSGLPVYDASQAFIFALMGEVYGQQHVERVYDWACDAGEVPSVSTVQELLAAEAARTREDQARHISALAFDLRNIGRHCRTEDDMRRLYGDAEVDQAIALNDLQELLSGDPWRPQA